MQKNAIVFVQGVVQVRTNQKNMEDDDWSFLGGPSLQLYEDNYTSIKHRKRNSKAL